MSAAANPVRQPAVAVEEVVRLLSTARCDLSREKSTQADIGLFLAGALPVGCGLHREFVLGPADRPDFLVDGRIAVEVKLKGSKAAIYHQLRRYARHERVEAVILVTRLAMGLPPEIEGKPAFYVSLGRAWL